MRKATLSLLCTLVILTGATASAQESPLLGTSHYSMEMAYMFLAHDTFAIDDYGVYLGLAGYGHLGDDWYLGSEIGVGGAFGLFGFDSSSYTPIEVNGKRAFSLSPRWAMDMGAGLSYSRVKFVNNAWFSESEIITDWVFGGQVLTNLYFQTGWAQVGLKIKYQLTTDVRGLEDLTLSSGGWDYTNLKISLQIGFRAPD